MRLISVDKLRPEMQLARPIYHGDGSTILLNTGCSNLISYVPKLKSLGINYIYIEDVQSQGIEVIDVVKEQTRLESTKIIHDVFAKTLANKDVNIATVKKAVTKMIGDILNNKTVLLNLMDIRTNDTYTFSHSVNVTVLALVIGRILNYSKEKLIKLGIGALLHDIGKAILPDEILNKPGKLTDEEFGIMKEHTKIGFEGIKNSYELSPLSKTIILSHHEKWDGTGYPRGIKGDEIHEFARIVAICDVFDALTSDRCYRPKWPVYEAIEFLMSYSGTHFDADLVKQFIKHIAAYPNGTPVKLNDGRKGIIQEQNEGFPTRPIIRILEDADGNQLSEYETVNLLQHLSLVVIDAE
jgi:putative nucleotidyltransferase with HDIG domain